MGITGACVGSAVFGARKLWHGVDVRGRLGQRQDATGSGALGDEARQLFVRELQVLLDDLLAHFPGHVTITTQLMGARAVVNSPPGLGGGR